MKRSVYTMMMIAVMAVSVNVSAQSRGMNSSRGNGRGSYVEMSGSRCQSYNNGYSCGRGGYCEGRAVSRNCRMSDGPRISCGGGYYMEGPVVAPAPPVLVAGLVPPVVAAPVPPVVPAPVPPVVPVDPTAAKVVAGVTAATAVAGFISMLMH